MQNLEVEFLSKVLSILVAIDNADSVVKEIRSKLGTGHHTLAIKFLVDASRITKEIVLPEIDNDRINKAMSTVKSQYLARGYRETENGFEYKSLPRIELTDARKFTCLCQQVFKL